MKNNPVPAVELIPDNHFLHNGKLGLLTNDVAATSSRIPSRLSLLERGFSIYKLFSPEHGLGANHADGLAVKNTVDTITGLPVTSLYGERLKPLPEDLRGLNGVLFDVPDVGCRFYTYLWSMTFMMEACAEEGVPFIILDRPNPIGGDLLKSEGPMLDELHCSSFIGRWRIPVRHSCTLGELAKYFQATRLPNLQLEVMACKGWDRSLSFFETGHPFLPTSPAIRDAETALLYPGTGLLEGIWLNEGRGTGFDFKQAGAPWIHPEKWNASLSEFYIRGIETEPVSFVPASGVYHGETCKGLRFHITDPFLFKPVLFGIELIRQLMHCFGELVQPRLYQTHANPTGANHLDLLLGIPNAFEALKKGNLPETNIAIDWEEMMRPFLIY